MGDEKKIKKLEEDVKQWLRALERNNKKLSNESKAKKIEKLKKEMENYKKYLLMDIENLKEEGGSFSNCLDEVTPFQQAFLNELFPDGFDDKNVITYKLIDDIKKEIEEVKKYKDVMTYDKNDDIKTKNKNKLFKEFVRLGRMVVCTEEKISGYYNEYWHYYRDYESTKDKYFTKEEQHIIEESAECFEEYSDDRKERYKFLINLGESITNAGEKIGEAGELAQAKIWAKNYYEDVFPDIVEKINGNMDKKMLIKESKEMTKRYISFITSEEETLKAKKEIEYYEQKSKEALIELRENTDDAKENLKGLIGGVSSYAINKMVKDLEKDPYAVLYDVLKSNLGIERGTFLIMYYREKIIDSKIETFSKYSFEEIGLE